MELNDFLRNLQATTKPELIKTVSEQLSFVETLQDTAREMLAAGVTFDQVVLNIPELKDLPGELKKRLPGVITLDNILIGTLDSSKELLKQIETDIKQIKDNIVTRETITIKQANLLLVSSAIECWVDYTNRVLDYGLAFQSKHNKRKMQRPDSEFLKSNFNIYVDITKLIFETHTVIAKRLKSMPDLPATEENIDVLEMTKGKEALIALPVRNWGLHNFTPVYWFKSTKLEFDLWRVKRHHANIESHALKLQQLQDEAIGNSSPRVENAIRVYTDKIIKAQDKLEKIYEAYEYNG